MTYIPDLAEVSYSGFKGPIRAVGWLESTHPFTRGSVEPDFRRRLMALVGRPLGAFGHWGMHWCTLCAAVGRIGPDGRSSQDILLVPGSSCVYEAPIWIGHYVIGHSYRPPDEFCLAVRSCPEPGSDEMLSALLTLLPELSRLAGLNMLFFAERDARDTLEPSPEYGAEPKLEKQLEKLELERERAPAFKLLEPVGGLSEAKCVWAGCESRALDKMTFCFDHAYLKGETK